MLTEAALASRSSDLVLRAIEAHGPILLATARMMTRDDDEAQDLLQTTLEIALRRIDDLRDPGAVRAWLLSIETREALRVMRKLRRFVALTGHVEEIAVPGPDARDVALRVALGRLPVRMRAAIALHYLAGLRVDETAEALGTSPNTVKTQLREGLARLRRELGDG